MINKHIQKPYIESLIKPVISQWLASLCGCQVLFWAQTKVSTNQYQPQSKYQHYEKKSNKYEWITYFEQIQLNEFSKKKYLA